jgi:hypothetical protein
MGSRLALPPDFDLARLRTDPARMLARAFRDYGACVGYNTGWDVYAVITEWGVDGKIINAASISGSIVNCVGTSGRAGLSGVGRQRFCDRT